MPDRLDEIRARLDAATPGPWEVLEESFDYTSVRTSDYSGTYAVVYSDEGRPVHRPDADLIAHAPADSAWLLAALESERRHSAMLAQRIDGHLLENVRLLAEIERLHGASVSERSQDTNLSVGKPLRTENGTELLPDEPVAQAVTKLERWR